MGNKIGCIRGTSGSGKSWIVRELMANYQTEPIRNEKGKARAYHIVDPNIFIIGNYDIRCGGPDNIRPISSVVGMVEEFVQLGNVIFEGLVVTNVFMMWVEMAHDLRTKYGAEFWFLPMNTPLDVCKARIQERNGGKEVSDKNTIKTWESNRRSGKKAEEAGFNVEWVDWENPMEAIRKVFPI